MKDSLDILLVNVTEDVTEYEPEFVVHDSLNILRTDVICHHGILGMKWGIRRYQNKDGSLTAAGIKRYNKNLNKRTKESSAYGYHKLAMKTRADINKYISEKDAEDISKAIEYGEGEDKVYEGIVEKFTKEKFNNKNKLHRDLLDDIRNYGGAAAYDKLGGERYAKIAKESKVASWERDTPKGYKLSEDSKKYGEHIAYEKQSSPNKKHQYTLIYEPSMHSNGPSKYHEEFDKNSEAIMKQCKDAVYDESVKMLRSWGGDMSKEEHSKYMSKDNPPVRIDTDHGIAEIDFYDRSIDHFPVTEYDMKNKKVIRVSIHG